MKKGNINRLLEIAKNEAKKSDFYPKIGCVVAIGNNIIGSGYNSTKTHTKQQFFNKYRPLVKVKEYTRSMIHAEGAALFPLYYANVEWQDVIVYTYRISTNTNEGYGLARPCEACMTLIKFLGIKNICYTTNDGIAFEKIKF